MIFNERIPFAFSNSDQTQAFVGPNDAVLKTMEAELDVQLVHRGDELIVQTEMEDAIRLATQVIGVLTQLVNRGAVLTERDATSAIQLARQNRVDELLELYDTVVHTNHKGKPLRAKTLGQARYVRGIEKYDLTFGIGPAGTGKTYLAVVMAAKALKEGHVKRLVLT
ncbi:MAG: PhoH family protein, partial [Exiguobacterium oxidotolerans]